jgi:hypothetical protein
MSLRMSVLTSHPIPEGMGLLANSVKFRSAVEGEIDRYILINLNVKLNLKFLK